MAETLVKQNFEFSTTDAENIEVFFFGVTDLVVKFEDYQNESWRIKFSEVVSFSWNLEELIYPEIDDEFVYEVKESALISHYKLKGEPTEKLKHYKLCFNAYGILDVVFEEMKVESHT